MDTHSSGSPIKSLPLRVPGQSLRNEAVDLVLRRLVPVFWVTSVACVLAIQAWINQRLNWHISFEAYTFVALGLGGACVLQFYYARRQLARLQLGRDGELAVGQYLDQYLIPKGARVIHDVPGDGFNLDHVVIAPQGVFVIETKTRTKPLRREARVTFASDGTLRVGGYAPDRDPITQIQAAARWLSDLLTEATGQVIRTRGVVVFPGWFIEPMSRAWLDGGRPWVLEPKSLPGFLAHELPVLTEREVVRLGSHLTRYVRSHQTAERKA